MATSQWSHRRLVTTEGHFLRLSVHQYIIKHIPVRIDPSVPSFVKEMFLWSGESGDEKRNLSVCAGYNPGDYPRKMLLVSLAIAENYPWIAGSTDFSRQMPGVSNIFSKPSRPFEKIVKNILVLTLVSPQMKTLFGIHSLFCRLQSRELSHIFLTPCSKPEVPRLCT